MEFILRMTSEIQVLRTGLSIALLASLIAGCGDNSSATCDPACGPGLTCSAGTCVAGDLAGSSKDFAVQMGDMPASNGCNPACSGSTPYCNSSNVCVPCLMSSQCQPGQVCKVVGNTSACVPGCTDDSRCTGGPDGGAGTQKCCDGQCIDVGRDPQNCGACGMACGVQHSTASCTNGACVPGKCLSGWGDCNMDPKDGCETNLHVDPNNCTACGMKCAVPNGIAACSDGCYLGACTFGWDDCNNDTKDGCETSTLSDPKNCGGCGMPCKNIAHTTIACVNASCALTKCDQGWSDCDKNPMNGCEVATGTDAANCGACGAACGQGQVCINSSCTCANCSFPNAKSKCVNFVCLFDVCLPGFADCDNNQKNGCEIDMTSDPNNCNGCGNVCPQNMKYCANSACTDVSPAVVYKADFTQGGTPMQQCTDWRTFAGLLVKNNYTKVTISGSLDNVGVSCTGNGANTICSALNTNQTVSVQCDGRTWRTGPCGGNSLELSASGNICQCDMAPGYVIRPCIMNLNWGGVFSTTCGGQNQTMQVSCQ
jgi:hypothetical protein